MAYAQYSKNESVSFNLFKSYMNSGLLMAIAWMLVGGFTGLTTPLQLAMVFTTSSFSDDDQRFRRQSIRSDISAVAV